MAAEVPATTHAYLAQRLDGARHLYLLALAWRQPGIALGTAHRTAQGQEAPVDPRSYGWTVNCPSRIRTWFT